MEKLVVSPSPHIRDRASTRGIMLTVCLALLPCLIAGTVLYGLRALLIAAVCVLSAVLSEYFWALIRKRRPTVGDLSAAVTGLILALSLPVGTPLWIALIGSVVAIIVVKQLFGGIGQNFANPAVVARIALMASFPKYLTSYMLPTWDGSKVDLVSGATPLEYIKLGKDALSGATSAATPADPVTLPTTVEYLFGLRGGAIGECCAIAIIAGFVILLLTRVITPTIPLTFVATVGLTAWVIGQSPVDHMLAGGVLFAAVFMATDYVTSPTTEWGKALFAVGCGVITVFIRAYSSYPEGVSFALLIMNILTPQIDKLFYRRIFGTGVAKQ